MVGFRLLLVCALFSVVGCDVQEILPVSPGGRKVDASKRAAERAAAEKAERDALAGERQVLSLHLKAVVRTLTDERVVRSNAVEQVRADRDALSARIRDLSSSACADGNSPRGKVIADVLADETVNAIAIRHLGQDFRMKLLAFKDDILAAKLQGSRRQAEENQILAEYEQTLKEAREGDERAKEQTKKSAEKLRLEIAKLESRRAKLQRGLAIVSTFERRKKEDELSSVDELLRRLRMSYDSIRSGRAVTEDERRASDSSARAQSMADMRKKDRTEQVRKNYHGTKTPSEIMDKFERETIGELRRVLGDKERQFADALSELNRVLTYVSSSADGLESMNSKALARLRSDVDERVAKVVCTK